MPTVKELSRHGILICMSFHSQGCPKTGVAFWRYAMYSFESKYYVIESDIVSGSIKTVVKLLKVGGLPKE